MSFDRWSSPCWIVLKGTILTCLLFMSMFFGALLPQTGQQAALATQVYGQVDLISSGNMHGNDLKGELDEAFISLHDLSVPAQGKAYYAWLLKDTNSETAYPPLLLAQLKVIGGRATHLYQNPTQDNLLTHYSRFLVTEENSTPQPVAPTTNAAAWRYSAIISQVCTEGKRYGLLDHLRHLLAVDPELHAASIGGGLDSGFFRNISKVKEWSQDARNGQITVANSADNSAYVQRQVERVLTYLDGIQLVQTEKLAASFDPTTLVDPVLGRIGLLALHKGGPRRDYLSHIAFHLFETAHAANATPAQRTLAAQIELAIDYVRSNLIKVHAVAVELLNMSREQIVNAQGLSLLNRMSKYANNAFIGQVNPQTNQVQRGAVEIHYDMQHLATLDVKACTGSRCI
jgi:hypothetical protein